MATYSDVGTCWAFLTLPNVPVPIVWVMLKFKNALGIIEDDYLK